MKPTLSVVVAGAMSLVAMPALAQNDTEDITVTGRFGRVPDNVQSLSQAVSYADLDLSTDAGRKMLQQRVRLTARYLCQKLGEPDNDSPPAPSCRDAATSDAMKRVGTVAERAAPRGTTWVARDAWQAPYPADWASRYP